MKNFALLKKNCEGFSPVAVIAYIQKCQHPLHSEKMFAGMLKYAMAKIAEKSNPNSRIYLYHLDKKSWSQEMLNAFDTAEQVYKDDFGKEAKIRMYRFSFENKIYYFIKGEQLGEKFELLFIEEQK